MEMDPWFQIVSAVIIGNGVSLFCFMAALKCHRMQKDGAKDNELPWWVYLGLLSAPAAALYGLILY